MMRKRLHEKVLRTTLRVTLVGALGACGGGGASKTTPTSGTSPTTSAVPPAVAAASPQSEADCRGALKASYPDGDPRWYDPNANTPRTATAVSDADLLSCCERHAGALGDEDYRSLGCCSVKYNGAHCTPWGPPMPPAMVA